MAAYHRVVIQMKERDMEKRIADYIKSWRFHSGLEYTEEITENTCLECAKGILEILKGDGKK